MKTTAGELRQLIREERKYVVTVRQLFGEVGHKVDGKQAARDKLKPHMKLTEFDKYGNVVPKNVPGKRPGMFKISTYSVGGGTDSVPAHLELIEPGGGINKHRETPGNGPYREVLIKMWDMLYAGDKQLGVSDAIKAWPQLETMLVDLDEKKAELEKVKVLPSETLVQKKYMDHSYTNEDQFIKAAAEYLLLRDMGQQPWNVDRDSFISEYGEDEYYEDLKSYAMKAATEILTLVDNDEPATMRNLEKLLRGKK